MNMKVKQEPAEYSERNTSVIKQESIFDTSITEKAISETLEEIKKRQLFPLLTVSIKGEPQENADEELFPNSTHDVSETQYSEVKAADLFVDPLNLIEQKVTQYIVPKAELLTEYCDLPYLKNDIDCEDGPSTSTHCEYILNQPNKDINKNKVKKYCCPICQKYYSTSQRRLKHFVGHFGRRWLACDFCGYFYANKFEYFTHNFKHFAKKTIFNCKTSNLKKHKHYHTQTKLYKFSQKQKKLKANQCVGQKRFKCETCSKLFSKNSDFNRHLKIHTGEKQFKCKICSKRFIQNRYLSRHLKIHTDEKTFKCEICLKQIKQKHNLKKHLKTHTGEKLFKCDICLKQFSLKQNLNTHLKIHTGEKPFKCESCLKQFIRKADWNRHLKTHTGEKPFQCKICFKQFIVKSDLNRHLISHTLEKSFTCEICSKQFKQKHHLNRHLKIHTAEKQFK